MDRSKQNKARELLVFALLGILLYFVIQKLFFILFPAALAFVFSQGIRSSFRRLKPLSEGVKRILVVLVLLIFFSFLSLLVILVTERILHTVTSLSASLTGAGESITRTLQNTIRSVEDFFSQILHRDLKNSFQSSLPAIFSKTAESLAAKLPQWIASVVAWIPRFFVSFFIFLICTYYFSCDWERLSGIFIKRISKEKRESLCRLKNRFFRGLIHYSRAYFLLFLFTFSVQFLGLVILKVSGAAGKAAFIALIDLLPVFGCGTVLIPWALFCLLSGKSALGASLLVLYLVHFVLRQILEPKIVGSSMGLHPVFSLVLVLGGLYLFGFFGMVLFPLIASCLVENEA